MERYYLTTAIDYANAAPHIGHAYEKIAADIIARFHRMSGREVFYLTGLDEHGSKVEKAAIAAGKTPQEFVDDISTKFKEAWQLLQISNDRFIRTTEPDHAKVVQEVFRRMRNKGDVYKGRYAGLYCEGCEDYLRERDLVDGMCPNHKKPPREMGEENFFFALTKYKEPLRKWIQSEKVVMPEFRRNEVLNQLDDEEFGDFSISRSKQSLTWGIPVPDDDDQVIYVWVDALTNYITGVGAFDETKQAMWKKFWPCDLHLIGKDIVKFHAIYWPAMLMSADIEPPRLVYGHGFITVEGQKMSKSVGNVLEPADLVHDYTADGVRYFLFQSNTFEMDGDFSGEQCVATLNSHLANNLGNLLNRTLTQIANKFDSKVPDGECESDKLATAHDAHQKYLKHMADFDFKKALEEAFAPVNEANKYLTEKEPWKLVKENPSAAAPILRTALELLKQGAVMLAPFTPTLCDAIWNQMGYDGQLSTAKFDDARCREPIASGQAIRKGDPVFPRIDPVNCRTYPKSKTPVA
jgi:methionyl-tRNA synthetase